MNQAMPRLMMDPRITMPLLSLPNHDARASSSATTPVPPKKGEPSNPKRDREKCEEMEKQSNKAKALCQPELKDCKQQDDQGRPICWAYILKKKGGCKEPVADGRCKKGRIFALDARFPVVTWLPAESIPKNWPRVQQVFRRCGNSCQTTMWRVAQCMSNMLKSIAATEFKLQEAKKKLRTLQKYTGE